jgi:hypothetical protein
MPTKKVFGFFAFYLPTSGTFTSVFNDNMSLRSYKKVEIKVFLKFCLLVEGSRSVQIITDPGGSKTSGSGKPVFRIRDIYPGSRFLPIPDLGSRIQKQQQKRGVKKN